jgi:uncharacterized radical SAM superfamily protein
MFLFGSHDDIAATYWDAALSSFGEKFEAKPIDEMTVQELERAVVYARMALTSAWSDGVITEVEQVLLDQYDELFQALAEASERFREVVRSGRHQPVGPWTRENIDKYKKLAGVLG